MRTVHGQSRCAIWTVIACLGAGVAVRAQWLNQPMSGAPRTPDGKVNITGPVPMLNGKPDLSGVWQVQGEPRAPGALFGLGESLNSKYFREPITFSVVEELLPETDLFEHYCLENEKDAAHVPGR